MYLGYSLNFYILLVHNMFIIFNVCLPVRERQGDGVMDRLTEEGE